MKFAISLALLTFVSLLFKNHLSVILDSPVSEHPSLIRILTDTKTDGVFIDGRSSTLVNPVNSDGTCCNTRAFGCGSNVCTIYWRVFCSRRNRFSSEYFNWGVNQTLDPPYFNIQHESCRGPADPSGIREIIYYYRPRPAFVGQPLDRFALPDMFPVEPPFELKGFGDKNSILMDSLALRTCYPLTGPNCDVLCIADSPNEICTLDGVLICLPGTSGPQCSEILDFCSLNPCQNSGVCTNQPGGFKCSCLIGFSGDICELASCLANDCVRGVCLAGSNCICTSEYIGENCDLFVCPPNDSVCKNGAVCLSNGGVRECVNCPTNTNAGQYCQISCNMPCINGICIELENRGVCSCLDGFEGDDCSLAIITSICDTNPCQNDGFCLPDVANPNDFFVCTCTENYRGDNCEEFSCSSDNCFNGVCVQDVACICLDFASGANCQYIDCSDVGDDVCLNGGVCNNDSTDLLRCTCPRNFAGPHCEHRCPINCDRNGVCVVNEEGDLECACLNGFSGEDCSISLAERTCGELDCKNGASCVELNSGFFCRCPPFFTGVDCSESTCDLNNCVNGACLTGEGCICKESYSGRSCEILSCNPDDCANGETCLIIDNQKSCSCEPRERTGQFCQYKCQRPCVFGECKFTNANILACECSTGYFGQLCDTRNVVQPIRSLLIVIFTIFLVIITVILALFIISLFTFKKEQKAEHVFRRKRDEKETAEDLDWEALKF